MKVYRISKCQYIDDLTGTGAAMYGGRWHNKGTHVLYTAATPSLALLESVVHIATIKAKGFCMICLDIPEDNITTLIINELPSEWFISPPTDALKFIGDAFINANKFLALRIPSVIMPEENNYLLNPSHKDFKKVKIIYNRTIPLDERLLRKPV